jgi:hypothetical protein
MAQRNISFAEKRRRFDIEDRKLELEIVELVRAMTHLLREDTEHSLSLVDSGYQNPEPGAL